MYLLFGHVAIEAPQISIELQRPIPRKDNVAYRFAHCAVHRED